MLALAACSSATPTPRDPDGAAPEGGPASSADKAPPAPATAQAASPRVERAPEPAIEPTGVAECDLLVGMLQSCMSKLGPSFGERAAHSSLAANVARVRQLTQGRTDSDPGEALETCQVGIRDLRAHPC